MNQVTLTLEEYNRILLENTLLKRAISVRTSWNKEQLIVEFDPRPVADILEPMVLQADPHGQYDVYPVADWGAAQTWMAKLQPEYKVVDGKIVQELPPVVEDAE